MRSPKCKVTMIAITSNKTQLAITMIAAFALVTTIGTTTPVFATHVWVIYPKTLQYIMIDAMLTNLK